jgi:hypothetical protein
VWGILMNLSFLPGDLHLSQSPNGQFVLRMAGREILSTKSQRTAVAKFNAIRSELETKFPARQPTREEKAKLLEREIKDSLLGQKNAGKRKKKASAGGSRSLRG